MGILLLTRTPAPANQFMRTMQYPKSPAWVRNLRKSEWAYYERLIRGSMIYVSLMAAVTLFAVFGDDIRLLAAPKSFDAGFDATFYACFAIFTIDITFSSLFEPRYLGSVIFFLDVISTLSMVLQPLFNNSSNSKLAIARVARLVRLVRVMRVTRLAATSSNVAMEHAARKKKKLLEASVDQIAPAASLTSRSTSRPKSDASGVPEPSKRRTSFLGTRQFQDDERPHKPNPYASASLARQLTDNQLFFEPNAGEDNPALKRSMIGVTLINRTTDKIILLVLILTFGVILLDSTVPDRVVETGVKMLESTFPALNNQGCFDPHLPGVEIRTFCPSAPCCERWGLLLERYISDFNLSLSNPKIRKLEFFGIQFFNDSTDDLRVVEMLVFNTGDSQAIADVSGLVKITSAWLISQTAWITIMLFVFPFLFGRDVLRLVITPLEIIFEQVKAIAVNPFSTLTISDMKQSRSFELDMIKEALNRLAKLLQVGLGQAGSDIIAHNLQYGNFSALQSGTKVEAVFGFCDIRNFTDCTEELEGECVSFVNAIAGIISNELVKSNGHINKNIGDAFLMVWKYIQTAEDLERVIKRRTLTKNSTLTEAVDNALLASIAMIERVAHSKLLQVTYGDNLRPRMGEDFKVKIGMGLHVGWAIEGAVGSELKIDATYLSSHVNMSMRLEGETKQYKVDLLMSEWFVGNLSMDHRLRCRAVDTVPAPFTEAASMTMFVYVPGEQEEARELVLESNKYFDLYTAGKWVECADQIHEFLRAHPDDGPAEAILSYINSFHLKAPVDWNGVRQSLPESTSTEGSRRRSSIAAGIETISEIGEDYLNSRDTLLETPHDVMLRQLSRIESERLQITTPRSTRNDQRPDWSWE
eukprot:c19312_g1_i1.p1 GENE.c19312_g1_i1~~c19312_g1_i1.p1  ORF type:complete len:871 (+),score=183.47 c19312_g1_i1:1-2613(+)